MLLKRPGEPGELKALFYSGTQPDLKGKISMKAFENHSIKMHKGKSTPQRVFRVPSMPSSER